MRVTAVLLLVGPLLVGPALSAEAAAAPAQPTRQADTSTTSVQAVPERGAVGGIAGGARGGVTGGSRGGSSGFRGGAGAVSGTSGGSDCSTGVDDLDEDEFTSGLDGDTGGFSSDSGYTSGFSSDGGYTSGFDEFGDQEYTSGLDDAYDDSFDDLSATDCGSQTSDGFSGSALLLTGALTGFSVLLGLALRARGGSGEPPAGGMPDSPVNLSK